MKRSKFSEAQIAFVLKQAEDGTSVGEVCRKTGISEATFYAWRKKYAGLMPSEMRRLRQLEGKRPVSPALLTRVMRKPQVRHCGRHRCGIMATRIIEMVGAEPRRRFSDDDKARIVSEAMMPGASVLDVARRHRVCTSSCSMMCADARRLSRDRRGRKSRSTTSCPIVVCSFSISGSRSALAASDAPEKVAAMSPTVCRFHAADRAWSGIVLADLRAHRAGPDCGWLNDRW
jgi:putative transposase